jgi:hypothetical protein
LSLSVTLVFGTQLALSQQRALLEHQRAVLEEQRRFQERQQAQLDSILAAVGGSAAVGGQDRAVIRTSAAGYRRADFAAAVTATAVPHAVLDYRGCAEERSSPVGLQPSPLVPTAPAVPDVHGLDVSAVPEQENLHRKLFGGFGSSQVLGTANHRLQ